MLFGLNNFFLLICRKLFQTRIYSMNFCETFKFNALLKANEFSKNFRTNSHKLKIKKQNEIVYRRCFTFFNRRKLTF